ncbi:TraR/DksA family transcriptional regulator [Segetibacter koreensis]|uniref:TraR/DksA family transcriptional regulator n=1 Tax=Segetibacter koreensis TaxID=398037 RepID=UPI0003787A5B|nr:TraR/DksA C4-type zinc finger protein [Segetibacter koreensis]
MAAKKPLKGAKPASDASEFLKKAGTTKVTSGKREPVVPLKPTKQTFDKQENKLATRTKSEFVADKFTKSTTGESRETDLDKPVTKKSKAPVKKTPIENSKDSKEVASTKKEVSEKKSKATVEVEKEIKTPKASSKAAKSAENNHVVIPKTSTDKKVDYEPDFMKSVLDTPASAPANPTMRYSDAELQEFRDLIGKKLDAAKKELAYLQGLITRRDEMGGDETDNRYMTMEDGGMSMEREQLSQMASRQITFIDHLEKALMRIENKTYGICRVTGKLIDKARLRAVPHATLSMEAKMGTTK